MKDFLIYVGLVMVTALVVLYVVGCASAKATEAELTYIGQQLKCVDKFDTRPEIDVCRRQVRLAWGIAETAGKDASE